MAHGPGLWGGFVVWPIVREGARLRGYLQKERTRTRARTMPPANQSTPAATFRNMPARTVVPVSLASLRNIPSHSAAHNDIVILQNRAQAIVTIRNSLAHTTESLRIAGLSHFVTTVRRSGIRGIAQDRGQLRMILSIRGLARMISGAYGNRRNHQDALYDKGC